MEAMQSSGAMVASLAAVTDGARRSHEAVSAFLAGGGVVQVLPAEVVAARPVRVLTEEEEHALGLARLCM
ncbi:MAG: hypothetical protein V3S29_13185 [bacterium]